jgi:hypothetical protein
MKRLLCPFLTCTLVVKMAEESAGIDTGALVSTAEIKMKRLLCPFLTFNFVESAQIDR